MEQLQHALAAETNEAMATRPFYLTIDETIDEIPMNKFINDGLGTHWVIGTKVIYCLI